ncbi:hypothetical protein V6N12_062644 [Hibiscus sabdariffa]|uniref:glucose-6-phosphate 1-epimerase n=1 Tax=Hibiscus sabdariffa TaxID=183260 RepID=A0ABR2F9F6_9ROSI
MSSDKEHVEHCKGVNGLDKVILRENRRCSAEVYLFGGQVTSWKNPQGEELLFLSSKAAFKPPRTIRGGIPICFPQFGNIGSLERHGFARNRIWSVDTDPPPCPSNVSHKAFIDLILRHSEEDMKIWPHRYECRLRVALGPTGDLMLTSRIRNTNTDGKPFSFRFGYQTYFFVTDIREWFTEQEDAITFESEVSVYISEAGLCLPCPFISNSFGFAFTVLLMKKVDKVYLSTPTKIAILDHERKRTFELRKDGLPDAVVWNPWDKKAKAMPDFGDDEYTNMLCVEAACVEEPVTLKPGEEWKGRLEISAVPSSYCSEQLDPRRPPPIGSTAKFAKHLCAHCLVSRLKALV